MGDEGPFSMEKLEAFARDKIRADLYPKDNHPFKVLSCSGCGFSPFSLTVEEHEGSETGDFMGVIRGVCWSCGVEEVLFSCTGGSGRIIQVEKPKCECGKGWFWLAILERYEGEGGLPGFFDEGVIVGQCARCGANRVMAETD